MLTDEQSKEEREQLKEKVANTLKWTVIDKVSVQLLYALTGIVLALTLTQVDFGLVGAVAVFQAFGSLFIDSGFASALIQKKSPTDEDYSTVLWFNLGMSVFLYLIFFIFAPFIADWYGGVSEIIPLARVMFLSLIINALTTVQANRFNKRMEMKMVTIANSAGLFAGSFIGIGMAVGGFGAWALVGQTLVLGAVRSAILWWKSSWRPSAFFSFSILRSFFKVGSGVMTTSFFNILYLNIYSFIIGNRVGMVGLGYYTQADKWSKMGVSSLSAVVTSTFLPVLSRYQDSPKDFASVTSKFCRLTAYLAFPALGMLAVLAPAIFHTLFKTKWDGSIPLFQLLLLQGMLVVISGLYSNFILSRGKAKLLVKSEFVKYIVAVIAIILTLPYISLSTPTDITRGIKIFLCGQIAASFTFWFIMSILAAKVTFRRWISILADLLPYILETAALVACIAALYYLPIPEWLIIIIGSVGGLAIYIGLNSLLGSKIQRDAMVFLKRRH